MVLMHSDTVKVSATLNKVKHSEIKKKLLSTLKLFENHYKII